MDVKLASNISQQTLPIAGMFLQFTGIQGFGQQVVGTDAQLQQKEAKDQKLQGRGASANGYSGHQAKTGGQEHVGPLVIASNGKEVTDQTEDGFQDVGREDHHLPNLNLLAF